MMHLLISIYRKGARNSNNFLKLSLIRKEIKETVDKYGETMGECYDSALKYVPLKLIVKSDALIRIQINILRYIGGDRDGTFEYFHEKISKLIGLANTEAQKKELISHVFFAICLGYERNKKNSYALFYVGEFISLFEKQIEKYKNKKITTIYNNAYLASNAENIKSNSAYEFFKKDLYIPQQAPYYLAYTDDEVKEMTNKLMRCFEEVKKSDRALDFIFSDFIAYTNAFYVEGIHKANSSDFLDKPRGNKACSSIEKFILSIIKKLREDKKLIRKWRAHFKDSALSKRLRRNLEIKKNKFYGEYFIKKDDKKLNNLPGSGGDSSSEEEDDDDIFNSKKDNQNQIIQFNNTINNPQAELMQKQLAACNEKSTLKNTINQLRATISDQNKQIAELKKLDKKSLNSQGKKLFDQTNNLEDKKKESGKINKKSDAIIKDGNELGNQWIKVADLNKEKSELESTIEKLKQSNKDLQNKIKLSCDRVRKLDSEKKGLETELLQKNKKIDELNKELKDSGTLNIKLQNDVRLAEQANNLIEKNETNLNISIQDLEKQLTSLQNIIQKKEGEIAQLNQKLTNAMKEKDEVLVQYNDLLDQGKNSDQTQKKKGNNNKIEKLDAIIKELGDKLADKGIKVDNLNEEKSELENTIKQLKQLNHEYKVRKEYFEKEMEKYCIENNDLKVKIQGYKGENLVLQKKYKKVEESLIEKEQEITALEQKIQLFEQMRNKLQNDFNFSKQANKLLENKNIKLEARIKDKEELKKNIQSLKKEIASLKKKCQNMEDIKLEIKKYKEEAKYLEKEQIRNCDEKNLLNDEILDLKKAINSLCKEKTEAIAQLNEQVNRCEKLKKANDELTTKHATLKKEMEKIKKTIETLGEENLNLKNKIKIKNKQNLELKARVNGLTEKNHKGTQVVNSLNLKLDEKNKENKKLGNQIKIKSKQNLELNARVNQLTSANETLANKTKALEEGKSDGKDKKTIQDMQNTIYDLTCENKKKTNEIAGLKKSHKPSATQKELQNKISFYQKIIGGLIFGGMALLGYLKSAMGGSKEGENFEEGADD